MALLGLGFSFAALAACDAPDGISPRKGTVTETRPQIAWADVAGATAYRVRLQSRVPNGRVVASHDTVVSAPSFSAPQPLAEHRAKVVVRLSAVCANETSAETVSSFVIDASANCVLEELSATAVSGRADLAWQPVAAASSYEVRAYTLDGQLAAAGESRVPRMQLDLRAQSAVVSVRPMCASGLGEAVYRVVAAD